MESINLGGKLQEGIDLIWETKYLDAENIFTETYNTDPIHALHYAEIGFWVAILSERQEDAIEAETRLAHSELLINEKLNPGKSYFGSYFFGATQSFLSENEKAFYTAALAEVITFSGVISIRKGDYLKGAYNIRRSWKTFEGIKDFEIEETDKTQILDDYIMSSQLFGLGSFLFLVSLVPPSFLWIVKAIGFSADRELGMMYLRNCVEQQEHRSYTAILLLIC